MRRSGLFLGLSLSLLTAWPAWAELAVTANDGKQLRPGESQTPTPDSVSILDLGHYPPKVLGSVEIPASMIGSPNAVAVGAKEKFAIVTASQKFNPADPTHPAADDKVSVIDLSDPAKPKLLQTLSSGPMASGVAINKSGNLVLVAAKGDGAIYIFRLAGKKLTPAGKVDLGAGAQPVDVIFAPDGRKAYAVVQSVNKIVELAVKGSNVTRTGNDVTSGRSPYGAVMSHDGAWLFVTNLQGAPEGEDRTGTIGILDVKAHKLAASVPVGRTPEHATLSPDGKYYAVVLGNGAATAKSDPNYDKVVGILKVFAVGPGTLDEVARADTCHWAQGAAWSDDGRLLFQQCAAERQIQVFRFDGHALVQDKDAALSFESRPGSMATRRTR
ncbi:MAG TPA: YncE family protein [Rhizomicrobium sp.]|nr:YncE family protein [Rhizomicrobium sp.]